MGAAWMHIDVMQSISWKTKELRKAMIDTAKQPCDVKNPILISASFLGSSHILYKIRAVEK